MKTLSKTKYLEGLKKMNGEERKSQEASMKAKRIQETRNHSDNAPKSNIPSIKRGGRLFNN